MTSSIPTPFPNSTSSAENAQPAAALDTFISAQSGATNQSAGADFSAMLDSSSSQAANTAAVQGHAEDSAAVGASDANSKDASHSSPSETASPAGAKRDVAEAVAAMLSPLWAQALPIPQVAAAAANSGGKSPVGEVVVQGQAPGASIATVADAPLGSASMAASMPGLYGKIAAAMSAETGEGLPAAPVGAPAVTAKGQRQAAQPGLMPSNGTIASPIALAAPSLVPGLSRYAEKFAANEVPAGSGAHSSEVSSKKNFVVTEEQEVNGGNQRDGIGIAKPSANMPTSSTGSRQIGATPEVTPAVAPSVETLGGTSAAQAPVPASSAPITPTLAPVLALRAVETVLNVVDAQQVGTGQGGAVKLDFNFGGEALAVHVQMRGGEVHTEFRTNSSELRSALSSQWNVSAGQRDAEGVRLVEPVFSSGQGGSSTANGSSATANFSFQQGSQQQPPSAHQPASLRSGRSSIPVPSPDAQDSVPASSILHPTSLHLAAVA